MYSTQYVTAGLFMCQEYTYVVLCLYSIYVLL